MPRKTFHARRSQLVSTFGVGSLFPVENNSFMVTSIDQWDDKYLTPAPEPRLASSLGVGRLLLPPTGPRAKVPVIRFPQVLSCPRCGRLGSIGDLKASHEDVLCGLCNSKAPLTPSRFVVACENGHLDDFPYMYWVHGAGAEREGHQLSLVSEGRTSSLADMIVVCSCGKRRSMADAFSPIALKEMKCTGKRLWLGWNYSEKECGKPPRTVQRGASNVWFPAVRSAISIPPYSEFLAKVVSMRADTLSHPDALTDAGKFALQGMVNEFNGRFTLDELRSEIKRQFHDADSQEETDDDRLREQEFQALITGRADQPDTDFVAETMPVPSSYRNWINAVRKVTRLREVRALYGFSRLMPSNQESPDIKLAALFPEDNKQSWLPAVETLGEGVFIALNREQLDKWAATDFAVARKHQLQHNINVAAKQRKQDAPKVEIVRVLLHTLAHVMIDQLALDAGYPASSIRERLYSGEGAAGILLYTASSDSAGSLGGVAAQAHPERLAQALDEGLRRLEWCSADPVCIESTGAGTDGRNLAACHCCVLIPETSCELFNSYLDRGLLYGTPYTPEEGFLHWQTKSPMEQPTTEGTDPVPEAVRQSLWENIYEDAKELRDLIIELVELKVAPDQWGPDVGPANEWMVDLAWPEHRIAVVTETNEERDAWLGDQGWNVLELPDYAPDDLANVIVGELEL
ncbi:MULTISPECIES: DUF1998 domain-containing protein [unclassified Arthrobacter]|uniref:DUF1998 domain-containing protein n=1 Tax=unclassified Arthrobacter TaxID=235627 RepID=UPI0011B0CBD4|nr:MULTISPECIES: DUF1998 domain-containing protein [unclassified Arthrobacter]